MACSFFDPERAAREAMALPTPEFVMSKPEDLEESLAPQNTFNNKRSERKDSVIEEEGGETKMDEENRVQTRSGPSPSPEPSPTQENSDQDSAGSSPRYAKKRMRY